MGRMHVDYAIRDYVAFGVMSFEIMLHSGLCRIRYSASRANVVRDNVVRVYDVRDFVVPPPHPGPELWTEQHRTMVTMDMFLYVK